MPAAPAVHGGQAARKRFEQCVRARVVAARSDVHVLRPEQVGERVRIERPDDAEALERGRRPPCERELEPVGIEVPVEPGERLRALAGIVRPAARDQPHPPPLQRIAARRRMEDRRVDRVRDDDRLPQLEAELAMLRERELRLEDRRGRERGVDLGDPRVGAVVEPPVRADRAVDPVDHAGPTLGEPPQAPEVEVERVEEASGRSAGDAVELDRETTAVELVCQGAEELMPAARRRRRELVEEGEVGVSGT